MARRSRKNIGLIGLGLIGSRVAAGLRGGGYKVYVWSRTPRAEPNFLGSPAKVAEICDIIQIFVSDAEAVYETIERLSGSLTPEHVIICNSTIGPIAVREAARRVEAQGAKFVDAPFTGSREAAEAKQLVYYTAGEAAVLDSVEPVLASTSKAIVRIGEIGQAAIVKVALNMIVAVSAQTLAEALAVVRQSGVEQRKFAEALSHHGARSALTDLKVPKMLERDYEPHFSLKHMFKDVQLAIHMANALDLDIPATTATAGVMYGGLNRGWGEQDFSVVSEIFPQPEIGEEAPEPEPEEQPAEAVKPSDQEKSEKVIEGKAASDEEKTPLEPPPKSEEPSAPPLEIPLEEKAPAFARLPPSEADAPKISPELEPTAEAKKEAAKEASGSFEASESSEANFPQPPALTADPAPSEAATGDSEARVPEEKISETPPARSRPPRPGGLLNALFGSRK